MQPHKEARSRDPIHIVIPSHQSKHEGEEQSAPYVPRNRHRFQQAWQIQQEQPQPYQIYETPYQPQNKGMVLSTHFVDQTALAVYSSGDYVLVWGGDNRVMVKNIAQKSTEADSHYHTLLLPTFSDTSVTSIAFCNNYLFYSTATAVYALQIIGNIGTIGPVYSQAVCLFRKQPTDAGPLHSLTVHRVDNLYVITICVGYGVQYSLDSAAYSPSPTSIIICEISIMMLKDSNTSNSSSTPDMPLELSSSVDAYKYVLDGPIFAITTAIDQGISQFFREMSSQRSRAYSSCPDAWPYNILNDQLEMYEKASFLKICVSTITTQPEILIIVLLLNMRTNLSEIADSHNMIFLKVWHIPFMNMSTGVTSDTLNPAKDPLVLSNDGSWLMCWSSAVRTKYAIWVLAFNVSFSSLLNSDFHNEGIEYHQFNLPLPYSITGESGTAPPCILQLLGTNFSSTQAFYILCRTGNSTALYVFSIQGPQRHPFSHHQRAPNQSQPTLMRIDKEYLSSGISPSPYIVSIASYQYMYYGVRNESQKQCEGICILWSNGFLSIAKNYQVSQSRIEQPSSQQFRKEQIYTNNQSRPTISVITQH